MEAGELGDKSLSMILGELRIYRLIQYIQYRSP
jgi:hypothetical protein